MVNSNSCISPELQQALSTVIDKRYHQNALKALELLEGEKEAFEEEARRRRNATAYLIDENARLKRRVSDLEECLQLETEDKDRIINQINELL